jgi:prephenate dehydrogenase
MLTWNNVAIIGVGLIGGSIGLALRQRNLAAQVIGIGRRMPAARKRKSSAQLRPPLSTSLSSAVIQSPGAKKTALRLPPPISFMIA